MRSYEYSSHTRQQAGQTDLEGYSGIPKSVAHFPEALEACLLEQEANMTPARCLEIVAKLRLPADNAKAIRGTAGPVNVTISS